MSENTNEQEPVEEPVVAAPTDEGDVPEPEHTVDPDDAEPAFDEEANEQAVEAQEDDEDGEEHPNDPSKLRSALAGPTQDDLNPAFAPLSGEHTDPETGEEADKDEDDDA